MSPSRILALTMVFLPGCALFGDPLLGTWELVEFDEYGPLTSTTVNGEATTTTTLRSITPSPTPRGDGTREAARGLALAPAPRE